MANVTTAETTKKELPSLDTAERYADALEEAAEFLRLHGQDKKIPVEIVCKAIGPKPPYCDSTNLGSMVDARDAFNKYQKDEQLFIERVLILTQ